MGTAAHLGELFGSNVQTLESQRRQFVFRYRSAQHWLDAFRDFYGPIHKAFAFLDAAGQTAFEHDLLGPRPRAQHLDHGRASHPERLPRGRRRQGGVGGPNFVPNR